ncbi:hypothetical protein ACCD08_00675 [Telluria sp. Tellsp104]|jgi:hypothetical protein
MTRASLRRLKRAVVKDGDGRAMLILLRRSVRLGHKRLALLRCLEAERMGLALDTDILQYCQQVADAMSSEELASVLARGPA